ncbi:oligosaccharide flippase family protein [Segnochrobactraceae bacterium EtOH-i3]
MSAIAALRRLPVPAGLRRRFANGLHADLLALGSAQMAVRVSRLVTTILLARVLSPADVGLAAVVLTVYELVAIITRNGISARVVQAGADEVMAVAETAHTLTWIICGGLVVVQLALAWPVALAFGDPRLAWPIMAMAPIYLATPLSSIQGAFIQREGRVRRFAAASAAQVIADNLLCGLLALTGLGMWAIILPKLLVAPIWAASLRFGHPWRAGRLFGGPLAGSRAILRFSRSVLGVEFLTTLQANVDNLLVGAFLGAEALGLYFFAFNAGLGITLGLVNAFGMAVFPHLCAARGDAGELRQRFRKSLWSLAVIVVPLVLLQVSLAPVYVPLVFGAKWAPAIPVLMLICLSALPRPFASATSQLLKAVGRPDIELRWQAGITVAFVLAILAALPFGIIGVAGAVLSVQLAGLTAFCLVAPRNVLGEGPTAAAPAPCPAG